MMATAGGVRSARADPSIGVPLALTVYLPIKNLAAAEAAARAMQTPGSSTYHQFLSVKQFIAAYADSDAQIAKVEATLENLGFTIQYVYANHLAIEVGSSVNNVESTFNVKLKQFTVDGRTGTASLTAQQIPAALAGLIRGIGGLNTMAYPKPRHVAALAAAGARKAAVAATSASLTGGTPGNYLPADFEKFYDVTPISSRGITGRGTTIGIVTLNTFTAADAYSFWQQIGLNVSQSRITKVNVDGGETASTNNTDGEGETDLDVEESGGIAPGASERVYIAPNISNANFIDGFEAAASENIADTVSSSWGQPELGFFYDAATKTPGETYQLQVFHEAFLEMALQGQSVFIAAGDSGSYDTVRDCPAYGTPTATAPTCNAPYAVDHPASDPLVTAAGGTTLPFSYSLGDVVLTVAQEQAWSWDYISSEAAAQGKASEFPVSSVFSTGGGGGVSSYWGEPWYQLATPGITRTKPGQTYTQNSGSGSVLQVTLPANFAGRNSPDISTNADPESGYQYIQDGAVSNFYGGTSFVAPQLNGVNALFVQALGGRTGELSPVLYQLSDLTTNDVTAGDNWGYNAITGFDNASGVGKLDAAKLLAGLTLLKALK
ncbi:S53 family peptidase [Lichenicoccus sp.]|uniref:S53 family peptidase n=1 Tax=Lichenicoccus sp. TaxID=2781899 RepID=UPI003D0CA7D5